MSYGWRAIAERPGVKAHLVGDEWPRTLCGMRILNTGPWTEIPDRPKCGSCIRREKMAHIWAHVLR